MAATNRLSLMCNRCGSLIALARLQGAGTEWLPARVPRTDYEAWLREHSICCDLPGLDVGLTSENPTFVMIGGQH